MVELKAVAITPGIAFNQNKEGIPIVVLMGRTTFGWTTSVEIDEATFKLIRKTMGW